MKPFFSTDVETAGIKDEYALQPWRVRQEKAWLTTMAFCRRDDKGLLSTRGKILQQGTEDGQLGHVDYQATRDQIAAVLELMIAGNYRGVGWNVTFDIAWMIAYGLYDLVIQIDWLDAMRVWQHLYRIPTHAGSISYALEVANKKFEKSYAAYKEGGKELYFDPGPSVRKKLLADNRDDSEVTLLHIERFWPQLTEQQQRCCLIEASSIPYVANANVTGMRIDKQAREVLSNTLRDAGHAVAEIMAPLGVTEAIVRSPAKMATLLYKKWKLPVLKYNDLTDAMKRKELETGVKVEPKPSTDKEVLYELGLEDERVHNLQLWREALGLNSKFMGGLRKSTDYNDENDITYPQAVIYGTYTSRMTYRSKQAKSEKSPQIGFAIHQMKRDKRFRNCIKAFADDEEIVEFDAASQEFKFMAILSGDPTMLALCQPGENAHTYMGAQIYERDYKAMELLIVSGGDKPPLENTPEEKTASDQRKLGKVANLSLQYRTSKRRLRVAARVQYGLPMGEDQAMHVWKTYRESYPGVPIYWKSQIMLGKQLGYAETLAGRRVYVEGDWTGEHQWAMESTMINYPIQGTGGEQKYLAMRCLRSTMAQYGARFAWDLHDGLYFYVKKDKAKAFAAAALRVLDNLPYKEAWNFVSPVPLTWDCTLGPTWGQLKGFKP